MSIEQARRLVRESFGSATRVTTEQYLRRLKEVSHQLEDEHCRAGDRVEATAAWGEFVPEGSRGTVNPAGDRLNIVWDVIDGKLLPICRTTGPFRVISAVDALAELAS